MTRDLILSLLRSGNDGAQILQILEAIASDEAPAVPTAEPTLEALEF